MHQNMEDVAGQDLGFDNDKNDRRSMMGGRNSLHDVARRSRAFNNNQGVIDLDEDMGN